VTTTDEEPPPPGVTRQDVFAVLGALGAIVTVIAAVMFYFGWRRSDVQAQTMGIDVSLFGFSSQDYVLRSISSLYLPLLVVFALVIAWTWLHGEVTNRLRSDGRTPARRDEMVAATQWGAVGATLVAALCLLFTAATGFRSPPWPVPSLMRLLDDRRWVVPLVLVVATLVATYLWWIHGQLAPSRPPRTRSLWQKIVPVLLVAATVGLGSFWMLGEYAAAVGRGYAREIAASVDRLPHAAVMSTAPLGIGIKGVVEERVQVGGASRYRTTGLRLLGRSGGKVLLLQEGWRIGTGAVIVLPDSNDLAWVFTR
jgi:hypothetical protein